MKILLSATSVITAVLLSAAGPQPEMLPVTQVIRKEDFQTRLYPGKVVTIAQVNVVPRVNGEILELGFENGGIVKEGQLLFRLDSVKYEAAVKNAEAKVAEYKARVTYAESNYQRIARLSESQAVSQDELESALSVRSTGAAALAAAEADLIAAKDDLQHCNILAPISGKAGSALLTCGNYVTPNSGTLVTIVQTTPIRVRFSISARDFLSMFEGKTSNMRQWGRVTLTLANGKTYGEKGEIEYTDNEADSDTDTIQVFARFPNAERILTPQATVGVTLTTVRGEPKAAVPPSAIAQDARGAYVWVVDSEQRVSKRSVVRGIMTDEYQLLESGVNPGELIVSDGIHKVAAGDKIEAVHVKEKK